jgi:hypothetical protein
VHGVSSDRCCSTARRNLLLTISRTTKSEPWIGSSRCRWSRVFLETLIGQMLKKFASYIDPSRALLCFHFTVAPYSCVRMCCWLCTALFLEAFTPGSWELALSLKVLLGAILKLTVSLEVIWQLIVPWKATAKLKDIRGRGTGDGGRGIRERTVSL